MSLPQCVAERCAGVADDRTGLCAAHRRSLTLSTKMQDAVREFLHGNLGPGNAIRPTTTNTRRVTDAGTLIAQGLVLLISCAFDTDDVGYDDKPISAVDLRDGTHTPWRVGFTWKSTINGTTWNENDESDGDDELDELMEAESP